MTKRLSKRARWGLTAAAVVLAGTITTLAITAHHHRHTQTHSQQPATSSPSQPVASPLVSTSASSTPASPSATRPAQPTRAIDYSNPAAVATAYVTAAYSLDYHWHNAAGYLPTIRPLSTTRHWAVDLAPLATAPSGQDFLDFQAKHGRWVVTVKGTQVPPGSPTSPTLTVLKVIYDQAVTGDDNPHSDGTPFVGSTNVILLKQGGRWLVDQVTENGG